VVYGFKNPGDCDSVNLFIQLCICGIENLLAKGLCYISVLQCFFYLQQYFCCYFCTIFNIQLHWIVVLLYVFRSFEYFGIVSGNIFSDSADASELCKKVLILYSKIVSSTCLYC